MTHINRVMAIGLLLGLTILPSSIFGADNAPPTPSNTYDCPNNKSPWGAWKAQKDGKTCRTRDVPQCKKENGQEKLAPEVKKTERECTEGSSPPAASAPPRPGTFKPPIAPGRPPIGIPSEKSEPSTSKKPPVSAIPRPTQPPVGVR